MLIYEGTLYQIAGKVLILLALFPLLWPREQQHDIHKAITTAALKTTHKNNILL